MRYVIEWLDSILKKAESCSDKALLYCWEYLAWKIQEQVEQDSYDTWNLARSITYRKVKEWVVEVWSWLEYAAVREYWRLPGTFPNLDALVGWTARKGMISWGATQRYDDLYYKDKSTVFLIARAIATRGIPWQYTFEKVIEREQKNVIDLYTEYMKKC